MSHAYKQASKKRKRDEADFEKATKKNKTTPQVRYMSLPAIENAYVVY